MKTRLLIIPVIVVAVSLSLLAIDQYVIALQDEEIKKSDWVQNCTLPESHHVISAIGIYNHTHNFDLRTCTWITTDRGTPGF